LAFWALFKLKNAHCWRGEGGGARPAAGRAGAGCRPSSGLELRLIQAPAGCLNGAPPP